MEDISNQSAIAMGNSRLQAVRDLNERIRDHNDSVADQIQSAKEQFQTANTIKQAQDSAQALWKGSKMPDALKSYKDYRAKQLAQKQGANPTDDFENSNKPNTTSATADAETSATTTTQPPAEPVAEGSPTNDAGAVASTGEEAQQGGSRLMKGLVSTGAITEEGAGKLSKVAGIAGEGAGALMSGAIGGMDIYNDFKGGFHIAGNNWEERAGNVLQIGGSIADIVGTVYPPAKLIGGVLDLTAGAIGEVGQQLDTTETDKLSAAQKSQTEQEVAETPQSSVAQEQIQ
jgi:hypothetical protein